MAVLTYLGVLALFPLAAAEFDGCTSLAVSPKATVEGSALGTHANDCTECDPRMAFIPASDHEAGSKRPVYPYLSAYPRFIGSRSKIYEAKAGEVETAPVAWIPEVSHTYAYWENSYPLMNEHGLGFGESTCSAKLVGQSVSEGGTALFTIEELMRVALERCKTAQCAIEVMGALGEEYGFSGEDPGEGGAGESLAVVDRDAAWVFHILGGLQNKSATWVAQRVPDGHVAVVANNFIIRQVNCNDAGNFLCSKNLFSNARAAELCDFATEEDFDFLKCYAPDNRFFRPSPGSEPIPWYTTLRMWRTMTLANPDVTIPNWPSNNPYDFPFSVPVKEKVSRTDVMEWMRDHYEGTEFDMTVGVLAGPFRNPNRVEGGDGMKEVPGQFTRGVSLQRTTYGVIAEAKANPSQSVAWLAIDAPDTSVFAPFFATSKTAALPYTLGRKETFSRDSAWWAFDFVNNWMGLNYHDMSRLVVKPKIEQEQRHIVNAVKDLEKNWPADQETVDQFQIRLQDDLVKSWWALGEQLISSFHDNEYTLPNGTRQSFGYPAWYLEMLGFSDEFYKPQWVQWSDMPPLRLLPFMPWFELDSTAKFASFMPSMSTFLPGLLVGVIFGAAAATAFRRRSKKSVLSQHFIE